MRFRIVALLVGVASLLWTSAAHADPTISIVWEPLNSSTIGTPSVSASSTVEASIVLTADASGVTGSFISIAYDATELFELQTTENATVNLPGMGHSFTPLVAGTAGGGASGLITGFDQSTTATGLLAADGPVTLGSILFHVVSATGTVGEDDVIVNVNVPVVDGIVAGAGGGFGQLCDQTTGGAGCIFVGADVLPEPGSSALGAFALVTLLGLKRRRA